MQKAVLTGIAFLSMISLGPPAVKGDTFTSASPLSVIASVDNGDGNQTTPKIGFWGGQFVAAWTSNGTSNITATTSFNGGSSWFTPKTIFTGDAKLHAVYHTSVSWIILWSQTTTDSSGTPSNTILYSSSSTDGVNWTDPVKIHNGPAASPDTSFDGEDTILISLGAELLRTTDGGLSWAMVTLADAANYSQTLFSQIASAGSGKWYLTVEGQYTVQEPGGVSSAYTTNLYVSTDGGQTWSSPVQPTGMGMGHIKELAARGDTIVTSNYPGIRSSADGGQTWTGSFGSDAGTQSIAVDENGNWIIVAQYYENPPAGPGLGNPLDRKVVLVTSSNPAAGWSAPVTLDSLMPMTDNPHVIAVESDGFYIVYQYYELDPILPSPDSDIRMAHRSSLGGNGVAPVPVNKVNLDELPFIDDTDVELQGTGGSLVLAAWLADADNAPGAEHVIVSRSTNWGGNWSIPVWVSGDYTFEPRSFSDVNIVYAGTGRWMISYNELGSEHGKYAISDDNGRTWDGPFDLEANYIAANGNGTIIKYAKNHDLSVHTVSRLPRNSTTWETPVSLPDPGAPLRIEIGVFANPTPDNWCLIPVANGASNLVYTSTDDGITWALTTGSNVPGNGRHDVDENGNIVALDYVSRGSLFAGYDLFARRSTNNGIDWSAPQLIGEIGSVITPLFSFDTGDVASVGNNTWVIGWDTSEYMVSNDGGLSWTARAGLPFENPFGNNRLNKPSLAGRSGNFMMAWHQPGEPGANKDLDIYHGTGQVAPGPAAARDWQLYR